MPDNVPSWSPADNPYAIAVSEAQWWLRCAQLASRRMRGGDDPRSPGVSSRQIDACQFVVALWQLLMQRNLSRWPCERWVFIETSTPISAARDSEA